MEFIKKMKKREFIEMGLKTLAAILAAFLAIILMEGMIYSIELNALKTKGSGYTIDAGTSVAYCIKESDDQYYIIYRNEGSEREWSCKKGEVLTYQQCQAMEGTKVKEVIMHAPNAFEFSISGVHFVVMGIFLAGVAGFFAYKFVALIKEYNRIETNFKKNGTIEF